MSYLCTLLCLLDIQYMQMDDEDVDLDSIASAHYIIATPGIKPSHRLYIDYISLILSELSFLWYLRSLGYFPRWWTNIKTIGITGTNGKSTTTWMLYQMLCNIQQSHCDFFSPHFWWDYEAHNKNVHIHIGGNFDKPMSGIIHDIISKSHATDYHIIVLEVSSFMLWRLQDFHFDIGIFLNLARDHQDRHKDMSDYLLAKANILSHADIAITSQSLANDLSHVQYHNNLWWKIIRPWVWSSLKKIISWLFGRDKSSSGHFLMYKSYEDLNNSGFIWEHNKLNAGAVHLVLTQLIWSYDESLWSSLLPIPHRLQPLDPIHGITIIDDAICTSAHALLTAINTQTDPFILICGWYDAGDDYTVLKKILIEKKPLIIVYGHIAPVLYAISKQSELNCHIVPTIEEAMDLAFSFAKKFFLTTILYSPWAKSFDQFDNVYHRIATFEDVIAKMRQRILS